MASAVVFAYHNVGVRCLSVLLAKEVDVKLIVTHTDHPQEVIWFESVAQLAKDYGIPVVYSSSISEDDLTSRIEKLAPDFIFSFYYRYMLSNDILRLAKYGCYNMHGSLLPKYRGRVPVNWAVLHGETQTGATLHVMTEKPDQGAIVGQKSVPILPNDTAGVVMQKVTVVAECCLEEVIMPLLEGKAVHQIQDLSQGSYFSGRTFEDGAIDWQLSASQVHNLVRAVAPPYPGAFFDIGTYRVRVFRTRVLNDINKQKRGQMWCDHSGIYIACPDGSVLSMLSVQIDDKALTPQNWHTFFSDTVVRL